MQNFVILEIFFTLALIFGHTSTTADHHLEQVDDQTCFTNIINCESGSHCQTCLANGNITPRCTQIQPLTPTSKVNALPFNRYAWLTTHNSYARLGVRSATGSLILAPTNQDDSITSQLNNGVRGLMLYMYDFNNDIWLCHGHCFNYTAFQPAINVLKEIQTFLEEHASEIITIFIEDRVTSPNGLTNVFDAAGLTAFWFPVSQIPKNGGDWPTVNNMIQKNQRLLVCTSDPTKEASEGIAYEWSYMMGMVECKPGCAQTEQNHLRWTDVTSKSLVLVNHFRSTPNYLETCKDNFSPLLSMVSTCYEAAGRWWPNFIAVNLYKKSDGGGSPEAVDVANGHLVCGCAYIAYCKASKSGIGGGCELS